MGIDNKNMDEETAIRVLKGFVSGDLYILLSTVNANMIGGFSIPYVGQMENGSKILFLFSDLKFAKEYCIKCGYEVLDGVYPLAKIEPDNVASNLEMIAKIATHVGVSNIDFNPTHETMAFGVAIPWMQKVLNYDLMNVSIILSDREMQEMQEKNNGTTPIRFNPMRILDFSNPYFIPEARREEINQIPLRKEGIIKDFVDDIKTLHLNELIYLSELINRRYIASAREENRVEDVQRFSHMFAIVDQVIIHILTQVKLFTLLDNGETLIKKGKAAYILYTDRFKYMGEYRYQEIDLTEFCNEMKEKGINSIIVTAGPGEMHLSSVNAIEEFIRMNGK